MHESEKHSLGDIKLYAVSITKKEEIADEVYILYFKNFFDFTPGQVVAISMKQNEPPRLYSICSSPNKDEIAILFKVNPGGFLTPRLAELKTGDQMMVSAAFGTFYGTEESDYWIAAGTGIAPFVSMQESGLAHNKILIHGGREEESFYFSSLFKSSNGLKYIACSSLMQKADFYKGRLTEYLKNEAIHLHKKFFVCGKSEMVVQVRDILIERGVAYENIIAEIYF
ncbi:MAG: oxidoreductase [Bacteroidales bacterium]|nr:oxidoreductase [Bacteroidales bacterium]